MYYYKREQYTYSPIAREMNFMKEKKDSEGKVNTKEEKGTSLLRR
jgi:hypothetical protein